MGLYCVCVRALLSLAKTIYEYGMSVCERQRQSVVCMLQIDAILPSIWPFRYIYIFLLEHYTHTYASAKRMACILHTQYLSHSQMSRLQIVHYAFFYFLFQYGDAYVFCYCLFVRVQLSFCSVHHIIIWVYHKYVYVNRWCSSFHFITVIKKNRKKPLFEYEISLNFAKHLIIYFMHNFFLVWIKINERTVHLLIYYTYQRTSTFFFNCCPRNDSLLCLKWCGVFFFHSFSSSNWYLT